jgi:hypothetical protein
MPLFGSLTLYFSVKLLNPYYMQFEQFDSSLFFQEVQKLSEEVDSEDGDGNLSFVSFYKKVKRLLPDDLNQAVKFMVHLHMQNEITLYKEEGKGACIQLKAQPFADSKIIEFFNFLPILNLMLRELRLSTSFPSIVIEYFDSQFMNDEFFDVLNEYTELDNQDRFIFLYVIGYFITYNKKRIELNRYSKFFSREVYLLFCQQINNETSKLIKAGLIEKKPERYSDEMGLSLTNKAILMVFPQWDLGVETQNHWVSFEKHQEGFTLYKPEDLKDVSLFFNERNQKFKDRIELIIKCTDKEKLSSSALAMMISGYPGTGKTAFAKKLCYDLGLLLMFVEMSDIQAKYIGETEQNIHRLFNQYRSLWKKSDKPVVLLFNECDQLFGRKVHVEKSSDLFSNAVQSQLLNEMENLNGILIATCNSTDNLEEAFRRRFLFNMEFEKPDFDTRKKIWCGLDGVWTNDTQILDSISQYELTGAQIDNVLKKMSLLSTIDDSIQGQLLFDLIEEEDGNLVGNKIGF